MAVRAILFVTIVATICVVANVPVTRAATIEELERQAEQGDLSAMHTLGVWYYGLAEQHGGKTDILKGLMLLLKAAERGYAESQFTIGALYASDGDTGKAITWFERAANQGHERAKEALAKLMQETRTERRAGASANVTELDDLEAELRERLRRYPVQNFYVITNPKPDRPEAATCVKMVIWNTAAKRVYTDGIPGTYCRMELGIKGIEMIDEQLRQKGIPEGYNENALYEFWYE